MRERGERIYQDARNKMNPQLKDYKKYHDRGDMTTEIRISGPRNM